MIRFACTSKSICELLSGLVKDIQVVSSVDLLSDKSQWVLLTDDDEVLSFVSQKHCHHIIFATPILSQGAVKPHKKITVIENKDKTLIDFIKIYTLTNIVSSFDFPAPITYLFNLIRQRYLRAGIDYPIREKFRLLQLALFETELDDLQKLTLQQALMQLELTKITLDDKLLFQPLRSLTEPEITLINQVPQIAAVSSQGYLGTEVSVLLESLLIGGDACLGSSLIKQISFFYECQCGLIEKGRRGGTFAKSEVFKLGSSELTASSAKILMNCYDRTSGLYPAIREVPSFYLEPGMVIAQDICDSSDEIMLKKNKKITQEVIDKIHKNSGLREIYDSLRIKISNVERE